MDAEPLFTVPLSGPTYHALTLVARIDRMEAAEIVETLVAAYLETRLGTIHEGRAAREVIDLAAQRDGSGPGIAGLAANRVSGSERTRAVLSKERGSTAPDQSYPRSDLSPRCAVCHEVIVLPALRCSSRRGDVSRM